MNAEVGIEEPPDEIVGTAVLVGNVDDVLAAYRATRISASRWYDTWTTWLAMFVVGHALVLLGATVAVAWFLGVTGGNGEPISFAIVPVPAVLGLAGGWLLKARIYGYRRGLTRRILDPPDGASRTICEFGTRDIVTRTNRDETRFAWERIREVAEFRDGFSLKRADNLWVWIPKRAFRPPFDPSAASAYFRERAPKFVAIDRAAGLPGAADRDDDAAGTVPASAPPPPLGMAAFVYDDPDRLAAQAAHREFVAKPGARRNSLFTTVVSGVGILGAGWFIQPDEPGLFWGLFLVFWIAFVLIPAWFGAGRLGAQTPWEKWYAGIPAGDDEVTYSFFPSHFSRTHRSDRINMSWDWVRRVVESADGFLLMTITGGEWIPKDALLAPFRPENLADLLRSNVPKYGVIDRPAGPPPGEEGAYRPPS